MEPGITFIKYNENVGKDVLFKVTQANSEKGNPSAPIRSQT